MGKVMTQELGRLEDLPADYVQDLRDLNLVPFGQNHEQQTS